MAKKKKAKPKTKKKEVFVIGHSKPMTVETVVEKPKKEKKPKFLRM